MALKKKPLWSNARLIFTKEPLFVWAPCVCVLYKNLEHNETVRYSTCSCFETALARYLGLSQQKQLKVELWPIRTSFPWEFECFESSRKSSSDTCIKELSAKNCLHNAKFSPQQPKLFWICLPEMHEEKFTLLVG